MNLPCDDPHNGQILAEVDDSIGCTHIGDWRSDQFEQTLVMSVVFNIILFFFFLTDGFHSGDCGGGINIFNVNN
jgi:hypothetical protein